MEEALGTDVDIIHGPLPEGSLIEIDKKVGLYGAQGLGHITEGAMDAIVTRNRKDFTDSSIPVYLPEEFLFCLFFKDLRLK